MQNPVGQALASYYPTAPAAYYAQPNYTFTGSYPNRGDQRFFKLDHLFTNWFRASASYVHQKTFEVDYPEDIFPNAGTPNQGFCCDRKIDATAANATITPDATTVITARWGFNRFYSRSTAGKRRLQPGLSGFARLAGQRHREPGLSGDHHGRLFELRRRDRGPGCLLFAQLQCDGVTIPRQAHA